MQRIFTPEVTEFLQRNVVKPSIPKMNQMGSSSPMDMDSESELFKISNCQYSFNELIVYIPIHGWQCKNLFGYRGEPLYELLLKWTYPSTFNPGSGVSRNGGTPEIIHFDRMLHCRPSSYWGTPGSRHCLHWDISRESLGPDRPHRCGSPSAKAV